MVDKFYFIWTTGRCINDCSCCCIDSPVHSKYHHIGRNETEREGFKNFLQTIDSKNACISLTGGDPLQNEFVLDITQKLRSYKLIQFNPLSFVTSELKRPGFKLGVEDIDSLVQNIESNGLSQRLITLTKRLSYFDVLGLSNGNMQCPYPELMDPVTTLFKEYIEPKIKEFALEHRGQEPKFQENNFMALGSQGREELSNRIHCVGKLRRSIKENPKRYTNVYPAEEYIVQHNCQGSDKNYNIFFEKEGGQVFMKFHACASVNLTPYTSFKTTLTLERMAKMSDEDIIGEFDEQRDKMMARAFFRLLNDDNFYKTQTARFRYGKRVQFQDYLDLVHQIIAKKGENSCSPISETFVVGSSIASSCQLCNTIGLILDRGGISPQEWQDYVERKTYLGV